jgi:hypothetical protein
MKNSFSEDNDVFLTLEQYKLILQSSLMISFAFWIIRLFIACLVGVYFYTPVSIFFAELKTLSPTFTYLTLLLIAFSFAYLLVHCENKLIGAALFSALIYLDELCRCMLPITWFGLKGAKFIQGERELLLIFFNKFHGGDIYQFSLHLRPLIYMFILCFISIFCSYKLFLDQNSNSVESSVESSVRFFIFIFPIVAFIIIAFCVYPIHRIDISLNKFN